MEEKERHSLKALTVEILEDGDSIKVFWQGRSTERNPGIFLTPILTEVAERASEGEKKIVMDFSKLEFMNSSTVTPVAKLLEQIKKGTGSVLLSYTRAKKWQELSFSALKIFETEDERIMITGI